MKNELEHQRLNEAKWDAWAKSLDGKGWKYDYLRRAQAFVISLLNTTENINFLDVGCGTGWAIGEAAKAANGKGNFYGVDLSSKMIEKAKENFNGRTNFHFVQANVESIPLEGNFFDIVICTNSFHHYLHPEKALNEIFRLLKNGGKVYILDPTADTWLSKVADRIIQFLEPEQVKLYSTEEFQKLFYQAGLKNPTSKVFNAHHKVHIAEK